MEDDQRRDQIWNRIAEIRDELDGLIRELEANQAPAHRRPILTLLKGGLGAVAAPALWAARRRPTRTQAVTTAVGLGITAAVITAIATSGPVRTEGAVPPAPQFSITSLSSGAVPPSSPASTAPSGTPGPAPSTAAGALPAPSRSPQASMGPAPATAQPPPSEATVPELPSLSLTLPIALPTTGIPTTGQPTPTPTPVRCLITIGVRNVISVCLL